MFQNYPLAMKFIQSGGNKADHSLQKMPSNRKTGYLIAHCPVLYWVFCIIHSLQINCVFLFRNWQVYPFLGFSLHWCYLHYTVCRVLFSRSLSHSRGLLFQAQLCKCMQWKHPIYLQSRGMFIVCFLSSFTEKIETSPKNMTEEIIINNTTMNY